MNNWICLFPPIILFLIHVVLSVAVDRPPTTYFYVKTPSLWLLLRVFDLEERLDLLPLSLLLLFDLLVLRSSLIFAWRYLRCIKARRLRRFVKRIPVNMTNEASSNIPPETYLILVTQV
jgi:hypothetical protein